MRSYVDSSVLLRIVLAEAEPLAEWDDLTPIASRLLVVESLRAIDRYRLMQAFGDDVVAERRAAILQLVEGFRLADLSQSVLDRAAEPFPLAVATLDAIHLATALEIRNEMADVAFATHDARLGMAARALGFQVLGT